MSIIDELASYDQVVNENEKASKLIRSSPQSFEPLSIISSMTNMKSDQLVTSVHVEIARHKK